jgi:stage V sporulation protein AE
MDMDFWLQLIKAFVIGGLFCVIAQILIDKTMLTPARILVLYVSLGVFLTAVGVYKPLVDFAGCGATTPLTGFGYSFAEGVRKAVDEKGLIGALTGGFTGASGGIAAAIIFGYLFALIFRSRPKK